MLGVWPDRQVPLFVLSTQPPVHSSGTNLRKWMRNIISLLYQNYKALLGPTFSSHRSASLISNIAERTVILLTTEAGRTSKIARQIIIIVSLLYSNVQSIARSHSLFSVLSPSQKQQRGHYSLQSTQAENLKNCQTNNLSLLYRNVHSNQDNPTITLSMD